VTRELLDKLLDAAGRNPDGFWGNGDVLGRHLDRHDAFATTLDEDVENARRWLAARPELKAKFAAAVSSYVDRVIASHQAAVPEAVPA
jgi:hypothetical protein